jgi:hypothetical protein
LRSGGGAGTGEKEGKGESCGGEIGCGVREERRKRIGIRVRDWSFEFFEESTVAIGTD